MCMMDWRIGRLIRSHREVVQNNSDPNATIPQNSSRVAIEFRFAGASRWCADDTCYIGSSSLVTLQGNTFLTLDAFNRVAMFSLVTHGELPTLGPWVVSNLDGGDIVVTQWFMPESMLTEALENYQREYGRWHR